jgi:hypothetical protein
MSRQEADLRPTAKGQLFMAGFRDIWQTLQEGDHESADRMINPFMETHRDFFRKTVVVTALNPDEYPIAIEGVTYRHVPGVSEGAGGTAIHKGYTNVANGKRLFPNFDGKTIHLSATFLGITTGFRYYRAPVLGKTGEPLINIRLKRKR